MKKQLGIKTSPLLWICRIVSILLFIGTVGGFFCSSIDLRSSDDLSEEYREMLMNEDSFKAATQAAIKMHREPNKYGRIDDITYIEFFSVQYPKGTTLSYYTIELVCVNLKSGQDKYFKVDSELELITKEEHENYTQHYSTSTIYRGAELKLIKEIAESEASSKEGGTK